MQADDTEVGSRFACSLSTKPASPLESGDWWLLLGFVAWMGFAARRKRMMRVTREIFPWIGGAALAGCAVLFC